MYTLNNIEKKQNIKFPEEYKRLYQSGLLNDFWGYELALENSAEGITFP